MSLDRFADGFLDSAIALSLVLLGLAFLLTIARIVIGPTLPDRVLGLDMLTSIAVGFIALIAIDTGFTFYVDIAIALGLVGLLTTIAFARFIEVNGRAAEATVPAPPSTARDTDPAPGLSTHDGAEP